MRLGHLTVFPKDLEGDGPKTVMTYAYWQALTPQQQHNLYQRYQKGVEYVYIQHEQTLFRVADLYTLQ